MLAEATDIRIIAYTHDDRDGVVRLLETILREDFSLPFSEEDRLGIERAPDVFAGGGSGFWLAKSHAEIVGTVALKDLGEGRGMLKRMFVASAFRGRAKGVSQHLLRAVVASAKGSGIREIYLGTPSFTLAAQRFYAKNGFKRIARSRMPENAPIVPVDTEFFVLPIEKDQPSSADASKSISGEHRGALAEGVRFEIEGPDAVEVPLRPTRTFARIAAASRQTE